MSILGYRKEGDLWIPITNHTTAMRPGEDFYCSFEFVETPMEERRHFPMPFPVGVNPRHNLPGPATRYPTPRMDPRTRQSSGYYARHTKRWGYTAWQ